jgi:hypothetical protein
MTKRIGNKHEAQHRGQEERKEIKRSNIAREAIKKATAKAKYHNQVKNQPAMSLA